MKFSVPIAGYGLPDPQFQHVGCFIDFVRSLVEALRDLGHEVVRPDGFWQPGHSNGRPIVFGAQNMINLEAPGDPGSWTPSDAILFNTEQTGAAGADPKRIFDAVKTWQNRVIWDYSEVNATKLREMGCKHVVLCPLGYHPSMTRIQPLLPEQEDIDVLFAGSVETPQRIAKFKRSPTIRVLDRGAILEDLRRAGLKVQHVFGVYGTDLDPILARAKVVLNLHYYEGAVFEIFRVSHLLANKKCVVTENGGIDGQLEEFAERSTIRLARKDIVEACKVLVADSHARRVQANAGHEEFLKTSLENNVKRALEQS